MGALKTKRFNLDYLKEYLELPNLTICINANVSELMEGDNEITAIKINGLKTKPILLKANIIICCNGGIEIPRLLLSSNNKSKNGVANSSGLVGKNFSGHPRGGLGVVKLKNKLNFSNSLILNHGFDNAKISLGIVIKENKLKNLNMGNMLVYFTPLDYNLP